MAHITEALREEGIHVAFTLDEWMDHTHEKDQERKNAAQNAERRLWNTLAPALAEAWRARSAIRAQGGPATAAEWATVELIQAGVHAGLTPDRNHPEGEVVDMYSNDSRLEYVFDYQGPPLQWREGELKRFRVVRMGFTKYDGTAIVQPQIMEVVE